ncbi:MAG: hypothetical protein WC204_11725 [Elusimicrobiales bacterium]|jgi:hypothetical protein
MKTLLVMTAVIAGFVSMTGAQNNPEPGQLTGSVSKSTAQPAVVPAQAPVTVATASASDFFRPVHRPASEGATLAVSTAPRSDSFQPFHSTVPVHAAQTGTLTAPAKQLPFAELRRKQIEEIKALRESLKGKPQSEIRNAVEAKKAEQRAAIKAQQGVDKDEAAKFKKGHPRPLKY